VSTTAPAARRTRVTAPLLPPSDDDASLDELLDAPRRAPPRFEADARFVERRALDFFAEDFFAEERLALDFFAEDFFADERFADDFFAVAFFAEERFALDFFALDFFAEPFFADERFVLDFFADDRLAEERFADDLRAPPALFEVAAAPDFMLRRAIPLFRVLLEDFERVAMGLLLCEEVCPAGMQELGTERHLRNTFVRNSTPFAENS
jgi:hypothetical protein